MLSEMSLLDRIKEFRFDSKIRKRTTKCKQKHDT